MNNLTKATFIASISVLGALSTNVQAGEWYYGIGGGQFEMRNLGNFNVNNSNVQATGSYSEGTSGSITIGRHIKGPFSIEASYTKVKNQNISIKGTNTGSIPSVIEGPQPDPTFHTDVELEQDIFNFSAAYRHQLTNTFYAKAKVGVSYYDLKVKTATTSNINGTQDNKSDFRELNRSEFGLVGGVGVGARLSSCCNIEVNYDRTTDFESIQGAFIWRF